MVLKYNDYKCYSCNFTTELFIDENILVNFPCPNCGISGTMARCVSSPGMVKTNFANKPGFKRRTKGPQT